MKVGDFVISKVTPTGYDSIVKILQITDYEIKVRHISYQASHKNYSMKEDNILETVLRNNTVSITDISPIISLRQLGKFLTKQPYIQNSQKGDFAKFIKDLLIKQFGDPPAKAVEVNRDKPELVSDTDLLSILKPQVVESGQVSGFIRINSI